MQSVTSNAVAQALLGVVAKGEIFGRDTGTYTKTLETGYYLFLGNYHPSINSQAIYLIGATGAGQSYFNRVKPIIADNTITLTISSNDNTLTITTTTFYRGLLIKLSNLSPTS